MAYDRPGTVRQWFTGKWNDLAARGMPAPLSPDERRTRNAEPVVLVNGLPTQHVTRRYDRGAGKFAYHSRKELLPYNPMGAGIPVLNPITQPFSGLTGRYKHGQIFWSLSPAVNWGRQPVTGPLWTPGQVAALMGDYATAAKMSPEEAQGIGGGSLAYRRGVFQ